MLFDENTLAGDWREEVIHRRDKGISGWLARLIGSCDVVRNPSLKSQRNVRRRLNALKGEVAGATRQKIENSAN